MDGDYQKVRQLNLISTFRGPARDIYLEHEEDPTSTKTGGGKWGQIYLFFFHKTLQSDPLITALEILDKSGDGAQFVRFKDGSAGLLLRPNATRYQIVHELKHYEHWLADPKKYGTLSKLEREEYVLRALQESNHWRLFNDAKRAHALEYIEYLRKLFGN